MHMQINFPFLIVPYNDFFISDDMLNELLITSMSNFFSFSLADDSISLSFMSILS